MASAAEQLASQMNWGAFTKATELKSRLLFVLGALIIYRIGTHVPLPGIDITVWNEIYSQKAGGILDMFNMFAGGALQRMTIFALNIMPYISASIIMQLAASMVPSLEAIKKEGEVGRIRINQYTRYLTVLLATVQAWGLSVGLESMQGAGGSSAVIDPGLFFRISTVITIVGGTVFLMWLGEQITQRGVGNGISLLIFAGIVAELPRATAGVLELGRQGQFHVLELVGLFAMVLAVIVLIVFMERAQRRIPVQYPRRQVGQNQVAAGQMSHLPLKLNTAGVIPPIFASSLLLLPMTLIGFSGGEGGDWVAEISRHLQHGQPVYMALYALLIAFFCFFYTAIVFNPKENADMLKKYGGFVPGMRPGQQTAEYLDFVLTRLTAIGAVYIIFICLLPEFLISRFSMPFYFGGTSLLIVVSVTMDTVAQIHAHMVAHQYEGLIRKQRLRGKR